jgi:hypothetical protein
MSPLDRSAILVPNAVAAVPAPDLLGQDAGGKSITPSALHASTVQEFSDALRQQGLGSNDGAGEVRGVSALHA